MLVGKAVAARRMTLGLQQQVVARALGITQASLSRLETGQSSFTAEQLSVVANVLKTSAGDLYADADRAATQLRAQGHKIARVDKEIEPDWKPIGAVVLAGLLLALAFGGKK